MSASPSPERALVLAVRPEIDGGRYPAKRVVGEALAIEADIVTDGHDVLRAIAAVRAPGETAWREIELEHAGNDAWRATTELTQLGRYHYTVLAWVDAFATWKRGLERKRAAGVDVHVELLEGAVLVEEALARGGDPGLLAFAARLRGSELVDASSRSSPASSADHAGGSGSSASIADRTAVALSPELAAMMAHAPDRSAAARYRRELEVLVERPLAACSAWYELFPRSARGDGTHGTLRDVEARLPYVAELGFDIIYLPPIHPIGFAFRKGPDNSPAAGPNDPGSPWAVGANGGGHTAVHPELGTLADFDHLVGAAREHGLEIALDIAFQASPDHPWVKEHPTWFKQRPDGTIQYAENPPKKYQDVYPFDFDSVDRDGLWAALRDVFLFWCDHGVRAFRVDNPHTKPIPFWEWCLREIHARFPDAIFLSEAFTRPKLMYALAKSGFSQSYTYFTWRTSKRELQQYATELAGVSEFFRPNFWPTTPDIFPEHLAHGGRPAFALRFVLAATLSSNYGIYGPSYELCEAIPRPGVEELARNEKYQIRAWNLDDEGSLRHLIARTNQIRRAHPSLCSNSLHFHETDNDFVLCYSKRAGGDTMLVIVNLDPHHTHRAWLTLDLAALGIGPDEGFQVHDLLGGAHYAWRGPRSFIELAPDQTPAHLFEVRQFIRSENQFEYFL